MSKTIKCFAVVRERDNELLTGSYSKPLIYFNKAMAERTVKNFPFRYSKVIECEIKLIY